MVVIGWQCKISVYSFFMYFLVISNVHFLSNVIFFNLFYVIVFIVECNENNTIIPILMLQCVNCY